MSQFVDHLKKYSTDFCIQLQAETSPSYLYILYHIAIVRALNMIKFHINAPNRLHWFMFHWKTAVRTVISWTQWDPSAS